MFRKTVLGLSAAFILGAAALVPTTASASGGGGGGGGGHHHHHNKWNKWGPGIGVYAGGYGYADDSCVVKKVKVWDEYEGGYYWTKKVVCY